MPPQLWVIAGPNGCGKSSLAKKFTFYQLPLVNPDTIAFELNPQDVSSVAIRAGKLALQMQQEYLLQKQSFIVETTLSGKHELRLIQKARELGFKVNLVYVCVDNPIISSGRVLERVARGGHSVPAEDIYRRYERSLENFPQAFENADRAYIFDNTSKRCRMLFVKEHGTIRHISKVLPSWVKPFTKKMRLCVQRDSCFSR